jgi:aspartate/glutamate racemase
MAATLALLHTTAVTIPVFAELARSELPGIRAVNLLDDSLLADVIAAGRVTEAVEARLCAYIDQAEVLGASAVMSCCSSIGEAMERIADSAPLPVWRVDEAMADEAVARGVRVAVLGTVATTMTPTVALIERTAARAGRSTRVESTVVDGAFDALRAGDAAGHDERVRRALDELADRADLVVLAQASTARVAAAMTAYPLPILTSPVSGLRRARERLAALGGSR